MFCISLLVLLHTRAQLLGCLLPASSSRILAGQASEHWTDYRRFAARNYATGQPAMWEYMTLCRPCEAILAHHDDETCPRKTNDVPFVGRGCWRVAGETIRGLVSWRADEMQESDNGLPCEGCDEGADKEAHEGEHDTEVTRDPAKATEESSESSQKERCKTIRGREERQPT